MPSLLSKSKLFPLGGSPKATVTPMQQGHRPEYLTALSLLATAHDFRVTYSKTTDAVEIHDAANNCSLFPDAFSALIAVRKKFNGAIPKVQLTQDDMHKVWDAEELAKKDFAKKQREAVRGQSPGSSPLGMNRPAREQIESELRRSGTIRRHRLKRLKSTSEAWRDARRETREAWTSKTK